MEKEFLSPEELAMKIGMSLSWVRKSATKRRIQGQVKFGNEWRFRILDVEKRLLSGGEFLLEKPNFSGRPVKDIGKSRKVFRS